MKGLIILFTLIVLFSSPLAMNSTPYVIDDAHAQAEVAKQAQEKAKEAAEKPKEAVEKTKETSQKSESNNKEPQTQSEEKSSQEKSVTTQKEQKIEEKAPQTGLPQSLPITPKGVPTIKEPVANETTEERHIVVLEEGTSPQEIARSHGLIPAFVYSKALNGLAGKIPPDIVEKLRQDPRVKSIEKDQVLFQFAQILPTGIDRIDAEKSIAKIDGVDERIQIDVAIVDSGVDLDHNDLNVNVAKSVDCTNDGTFVTCSRGGNDILGHGTHVAGIVAAIDNDQGVVGVAPGANIWSVKVLGDDGAGWMSWLIAGIDYVTENAAEVEVVNLSLGCECHSVALDDAISRSVSRGIVYVAAAGNAAKDVSTFSPANHPDVITVSAIVDFDGKPGSKAARGCINDDDDTFAFFSNYGKGVDLAAPGACIFSTWANGGYGTQSGTSVAAPHVAGTVALYLSENPKPQNADDVRKVRQAIIDMGFPASGSDGYSSSDDPDGIAEPLVNAGAIASSSEEQEEKTEPIEKVPPKEEEIDEEKQKSDVEEKFKGRGLEIAEKMRGKGLGGQIAQRGLEIAKIMTSQNFAAKIEADPALKLASKMATMDESKLILGINISEEPVEREIFAKAKSEVIINEIESKDDVKQRVQSLLSKLKEGEYYGTTFEHEIQSLDLIFNGNAKSMDKAEDLVFSGELFLESLAQNSTIKFKVTGGEIIIGESTFDVMFGKGILVPSVDGSSLVLIAQILDLEGNITTAKLLFSINQSLDDIEQEPIQLTLRTPQSRISSLYFIDGMGQIAKL